MDWIVDHLGRLALAAMVLLGAAGLVVDHQVVTANDHVATCTVQNMDRGATSDGSSNYRVYTRECGVLADEDSPIWYGKTNSADVWGQLQPGHVYQLHVAGVRWSLASWFPNIIGVQADQGAAA
jgi:hypothetical protein